MKILKTKSGQNRVIFRDENPRSSVYFTGTPTKNTVRITVNGDLYSKVRNAIGRTHDELSPNESPRWLNVSAIDIWRVQFELTPVEKDD